eukprot:TRINITY_DN346_c0_g1_i1.p1 TRINITY_DN346_c0_g1~~TRINITY_DN346_c0_g1_i1.p1  ORF type:complete len:366 (+),score=90.76 TRINITY_DN346_c0_g1_i1:88-1185(+)
MARPPPSTLVAVVLLLTAFLYVSHNQATTGESGRTTVHVPVPVPVPVPIPVPVPVPVHAGSSQPVGASFAGRPAFGCLPELQIEPNLTAFRSRLCTYTQVSQEWVTTYLAEMGDGPNRIHRKQWEFAVIVEALDKLNVIREGSRGLGFAVGQEPLARYFVKRGSRVTVSDMPLQNNYRGEWASTGQHAGQLENTFKPGLITLEEYTMRANFEPIDMNKIPKHLLQGEYDFIWSCGSLEHVGVGQASLQFVINSLDALKVGGVAAHTTEFLLNSRDTFESNGLNFFTEQEMRDWATVLRELGHTVIEQEFAAGTTFDIDAQGDHRTDNHIQLLDHYSKARVHTSVSLIIIKGPPTGKHVDLPPRRK